MMLDPNSGAAAYMISGGTAGGCTSIVVDMAACLVIIIGIIMILESAMVFIGVWTLFGEIPLTTSLLTGLGSLFLTGLGLHDLIDSFILAWSYYIDHEQFAGDALVTKGAIYIVGAAILYPVSKYVIAEFPEARNIFNFILEMSSAGKLITAGYSREFVIEIAKKSGLKALIQVEQLVSELEGMGISKALIEQIGKNMGLESLNVIKGILNSGVPISEIEILLNRGINITDDILYLAQRGIRPSHFEQYGIINNAEIKYAIEFLKEGLSAEDIAYLVSKGLTGGKAGVWNLVHTERGNVIEFILSKTEYFEWYYVGAEYGGYFPTIDFQKGNTVVSLKSIDPKLYLGDEATNSLLIDLNSLKNETILINGNEIPNSSKVLDIRIPRATGNLINMEKLIDYSDGIIITVKEFY